MTRGSVISESLIYLSYHNIDSVHAFQLAELLIRYYRNVWLDRFEIAPTGDWPAGIRAAREQATGVIAIVTDDYLRSSCCRAEFESFRSRHVPVTAVITRDFSTDMIADFTFNDWVDFRRWFDEPDDLSVENLLSQIPQSESVPQTGERLDYLRRFVQDAENSLSKMPSSWAAMRNGEAPGAGDIRPRLLHTDLITDWVFTVEKGGSKSPLTDLLSWSRQEEQFALCGEPGSGKTFFARLLALAQAHAALNDPGAASPIWLDLARWDEDTHTIAQFVESQWRLVSYWQHWLESQQALIILDNWTVFCRSYPGYALDVTNWIDASPNQRFIVLESGGGAVDLNLPKVWLEPVDAALALKAASGFLTLDQQNSFRQLLRQQKAVIEDSPLSYLAIGIELLSADRALAFNQWRRNPIREIVRLRSQQRPTALLGQTRDELMSLLEGLAWSMMQRDNTRYVARADVEKQLNDIHLIEYALDIGLLVEHGSQLSFESDLLQTWLAAESLKRDGLIKYLTRPEFDAAAGRTPRKWDRVVAQVVASVSAENRLRLIDHIAEIDPFVANMCLRRHPELYDSYQETLIKKLVRLCAQNPAAHDAFRGVIAGLPAPDKTAESLMSQLSQLSNKQQLWLWREIRDLPLELPVDFLELVRHVDRRDARPASERLPAYSLSRSVAYLVKLSRHDEEALRRNAVWLLGELKYLPTAILLLDILETADRNDLDEVVHALMNFAYSEILARVLRWSQDKPTHRATVIAALATRKRWVTSRLLYLADARRLTLNPSFYDIVINHAESDIAIGLAQLASGHVQLPETVETEILARSNAAELQQLIAGAMKQLPNREGFQLLADDIVNVLRYPAEATVIAGSKIDALLYGAKVFDGFTAQAETANSASLPADIPRQLRHSDWQQRHRSVNSLASLPAAAALPHLLEATADVDRRVRLAAYEILSRFEAEIAAQKALIAALSDSDEELVAAVTELLRGKTLREADALYDLLESENPVAAAAAISLLSDSGAAQATTELRRLVHDERRPASGGPTLGQLARAAISRLETSAMTGSGSPEADQMSPAEAADRFSNEEKVRRTLQVLRDDDWGRTQKAAKFLRKFARHLRGGDNAAVRQLLCAALSDANWSVRWAATEALAVLRDRAAIPSVSACLNDTSWIVQVAAIRAMVELDAADLAERIVPLLNSQRQQVREAAAEGLGNLKNYATLASLGSVLRGEPDDFVRLAALKSICQISRKDARPWLELALSDGYAPIRIVAMQQLLPELDESDLPVLRQMLQDDEKPAWESVSLRDLAIQALRRIDNPESRALLASLRPIGDQARA